MTMIQSLFNSINGCGNIGKEFPLDVAALEMVLMPPPSAAPSRSASSFNLGNLGSRFSTEPWGSRASSLSAGDLGRPLTTARCWSASSFNRQAVGFSTAPADGCRASSQPANKISVAAPKTYSCGSNLTKLMSTLGLQRAGSGVFGSSELDEDSPAHGSKAGARAHNQFVRVDQVESCQGSLCAADFMTGKAAGDVCALSGGDTGKSNVIDQGCDRECDQECDRDSDQEGDGVNAADRVLPAWPPQNTWVHLPPPDGEYVAVPDSMHARVLPSPMPRAPIDSFHAASHPRRPGDASTLHNILEHKHSAAGASASSARHSHLPPFYDSQPGNLSNVLEATDSLDAGSTIPSSAGELPGPSSRRLNQLHASDSTSQLASYPSGPSVHSGTSALSSSASEARVSGARARASQAAGPDTDALANMLLTVPATTPCPAGFPQQRCLAGAGRCFVCAATSRQQRRSV